MKEFLNINDRISFIIDSQLDGNQKKFAEKIGFAPQVIYNIISGRKSKPSFDVLLAIASSFDDMSIDWLLTGKGEMLKKATNTKLPVARLSPGNEAGIPLIPAEAMAGISRGDVSVMELDCERYVVPVFKGADFLIPVKGSSMYPKYSSGDIIACKKLPLADIFFQWNKVYVLDTVQGPLIKRISKGSDKDSIMLVSENPNYESFELLISQIRAVALVMGVIRLE